MNRRFALVAACSLAISLTACASDAADQARPAERTTTSTSAAAPSTTTAPATTTTEADEGAPVDGPADAVDLTCDGTTASLATELVATQPDGIHLTVHNTSDAEVAVNFVDRGNVVSPGTTKLVEDMKPRTLTISCGYDQNRTIVLAGDVEVVDRDGNWIPTDIDCTKLPITRWEEPLGVGATPEDAIRWWGANRPDDLIEPHAPDDEIAIVGYPEADAKRYVTRHDARDTNIFQLTQQDDGTWQAVPHENCPR